MKKSFQTGKYLKDRRYQIEAKYSPGGQAYVYLAIDYTRNERVIIKQAKEDEGFHEAINQERGILQSLNHPLLPRVHDFFSEDESTFLVMTYIIGNDLGSLIRERGFPFSTSEVTEWIFQLLNILIYLQKQTNQLVHGDIKPDNIRLSKDRFIHLLDFGITSKEGGKNAFVCGRSKHYSSPEQIRDEELSFASDVYSLAATAYFLLTAQPPADAEDRMNNKQDPLIPILQLRPEVSHKLAVLIEESLSLKVENRPQNAQEMMERLRFTLETDVLSRFDEIETKIKPTSQRILFNLTEDSQKTKEFLETDFSKYNLKNLTNDSTVVTLQLLDLIESNRGVLDKTAHIIIQIIDASQPERKKILENFGNFLEALIENNEPVRNYLKKAIEGAVCDPEVHRRLRNKLSDIIISKGLIATNQQETTKSPIETNNDKNKLKNIRAEAFIWCIRGGIISIFFSLLLSVWFYEQLINATTIVVLISVLVMVLLVIGLVFYYMKLNSGKLNNTKIDQHLIIFKVIGFFCGFILVVTFILVLLKVTL